MKNLSISSLGTIIRSLLQATQKYLGFVAVIAVLLIYGFIMLRISTLSNIEPTDEAVNEKVGTVKRLKIDEATIKKIEQLHDQNVNVQSLFDSARDNPFEGQ
jgi:Na+/melibiose symporter-like transporter